MRTILVLLATITISPAFTQNPGIEAIPPSLQIEWDAPHFTKGLHTGPLTNPYEGMVVSNGQMHINAQVFSHELILNLGLNGTWGKFHVVHPGDSRTNIQSQCNPDQNTIRVEYGFFKGGKLIIDVDLDPTNNAEISATAEGKIPWINLILEKKPGFLDPDMPRPEVREGSIVQVIPGKSVWTISSTLKGDTKKGTFDIQKDNIFLESGEQIDVSVTLSGGENSRSKAKLRLASPFTNHMVLQCESQVPVWGWAEPGQVITVAFADQKKTGTVNADGEWHIDLDPLQVSFEPRTLEAYTGRKSKGEILRCSDVLVGEVWICSGQSNMQFPIDPVPEVKALLPLKSHIRSFTVGRTVAFEEQDTLEGAWLVEAPNSAVACSFAHFLEKATRTPVGIILTTWGSTSIEAWMPHDMAEEFSYFKTIMDEWDADTAAQERIRAAQEGPLPWSRPEDIFMRRHSNIVYNAMMHPLVPFACRGLVWYQGERNAATMHGMETDLWYRRTSGIQQYGDVLKAWISRYRKGWDNDRMHFLVVMLPGYGNTLESGPETGPQSPVAHSWAWMREAQLRALELSHTGVANTIDTGDPDNAHPKDKLPVGQRVALLAAKDVYDRDLIARGPMFESAEVRGETIVVRFKHAEGLKTTDGQAPSAFWLADDSGRWVRAVARLDGGSVILHSPELSKPEYVRYAFAGMPEVNLVNEAGLPAYPFRTDKDKP